MYELEVKGQFSAAHAIVIQGEREPLHGHDWSVTVTVSGEMLDAEGLLCDFHAIESALSSITVRFHNRNLNETEPFNRLNPTAEHVARYVAEEMSKRLATVLPDGARIASVRVTEAPGCAATFRPDA